MSRLYRLLTLLSPAFPTGGFAYSHGLEWAVEAGDVTSAATLAAWLADCLEHGAGWSDACLVRMAHDHARMRTPLAPLAALAAALAGPAERHLETLAMGNAFAKALTAWDENLPPLPEPVPYPVAVGAAAEWCGIGAEEAATGYLQAWTATLVSAGLRLIPLGQSAGVSVLARLEPVADAVAAATAGASEADLGTASFRADLAAMHHETQYTRLFRS